MRTDITKGTVAICGIGCLGLIIEDKPKDIVYPNGTPGIAYVGIHLTDKVCPIGGPWSSRNPRVVGHINNYMVDLIRKGTVLRAIDPCEMISDGRKTLTVGREYHVIGEWDGVFTIIDDEDDNHSFTKSECHNYFEIVNI